MRIAIPLALSLLASAGSFGQTQRQVAPPAEHYQKTRGNILAPGPQPVAASSTVVGSPRDFDGISPELRARYGLGPQIVSKPLDRTGPKLGTPQRLAGTVAKWDGATTVEIETKRPRRVWVQDAEIREEGYRVGTALRKSWIPPKTTTVGHWETNQSPVMVRISGIAPGSVTAGDRISWTVAMGGRRQDAGSNRDPFPLEPEPPIRPQERPGPPPAPG